MRLRWQENGASQLDILRAVRANGEIQQSVVEEKNADSVHNIKCPTCRKTGDVDLSKHVIHGCSDPVPENYEGEKSVCVVCTEKWADVFFVGCGHNVMCQGCVRKMSAIGQ
jgi:ssDNA-binding Zn-finger/Zn-ribbon topoisomerase 1